MQGVFVRRLEGSLLARCGRTVVLLLALFGTLVVPPLSHAEQVSSTLTIVVRVLPPPCRLNAQTPPTQRECRVQPASWATEATGATAVPRTTVAAPGADGREGPATADAPRIVHVRF